MFTRLSQPGEMVVILVKGYCNQGKLTYFSHKIAPLPGFSNDYSIYTKSYFLRGTRQSNVSKDFIYWFKQLSMVYGG